MPRRQETTPYKVQLNLNTIRNISSLISRVSKVIIGNGGVSDGRTSTSKRHGRSPRFPTGNVKEINATPLWAPFLISPDAG